ncbi:glycerol-3-phosphate responsive antiterminator [Clostridium sp.]|uniref:glycerol-3-phosphate responsive antiterminator n=1 Tax=Clostridium sp. TaxID=1506 RepID=UPI003217FF16
MDSRKLLEENPIIAAVKNEGELELALSSEVQVIFVLFGDILNIKEISEKVHAADKVGIVHIDLIDGITNREVAIKYLKKETYFKGVISTKSQVVKYAKAHDLLGIQRVFIFDTISLNNSIKHLGAECDAIEVLPGVIPKVIEQLAEKSQKPIVAGGLIESKEEVIMALKSGATCVSTTKEEIWAM